eukprot:12420086-Karenia_brevis.AAC.1
MPDTLGYQFRKLDKGVVSCGSCAAEPGTSSLESSATRPSCLSQLESKELLDLCTVLAPLRLGMTMIEGEGSKG